MSEYPPQGPRAGAGSEPPQGMPLGVPKRVMVKPAPSASPEYRVTYTLTEEVLVKLADLENSYQLTEECMGKPADVEESYQLTEECVAKVADRENSYTLTETVEVSVS